MITRASSARGEQKSLPKQGHRRLINADRSILDRSLHGHRAVNAVDVSRGTSAPLVPEPTLAPAGSAGTGRNLSPPKRAPGRAENKLPKPYGSSAEPLYGLLRTLWVVGARQEEGLDDGTPGLTVGAGVPEALA